MPTEPPRSTLTRSLVVGLAGLLITSAIVVNVIDAADPRIGEGREPFVTTYRGERDQIDAVLVSGDGQAFAAIAEDPLLARPEVMPGHGEFTYRAQRPLWGYLAWAGTGGHAAFVGWALAFLTVAAAGACVGVLAFLLMKRNQSPWWALAVLAAGIESLSQLTPELLGVALLGGALCLPRERRRAAIVLCCAAALTRESLLIAVAGWACFEVVHAAGSLTARVRSAVRFAIPFATYLGWILLLRLRVGTWVWEQPYERMTRPFAGLRDAFDPLSGRITLSVAVALTLTGLCLWLARGDVLTWVAVGFVPFATTFSGQVWTSAGSERTLLPLYAFGGIAALAGLRRRTAPSSERTHDPGSIPAAPRGSSVPI